MRQRRHCQGDDQLPQLGILDLGEGAQQIRRTDVANQAQYLGLPAFLLVAGKEKTGFHPEHARCERAGWSRRDLMNGRDREQMTLAP
jgi:hypothetical protein